MLEALQSLKSVINNSEGAVDTNRALTFIEFIKNFGYNNDNNTFLKFYNAYLGEWAKTQHTDKEMTNEEFVQAKMIEILKTITLTYTSYDEERFIANLDWTNPEEVKIVVPIYTKRIREICDFFRNKRNSASLVVAKNNRKGSTKSIEEVIYNKVVDFVFNNRNVTPQIAQIKRDLAISIENYVDVYSEYFNIPREKEQQDTSRDMLSANMNDVSYREYLEISEVISDILYSGNVYLNEIPLIAQLALDLNQQCVGDLLVLKNELIEEATLNRVPLTEQVALKRRLYEKFLGVDLYYLYVDSNKNMKLDKLCAASNPSGNLLNCDTPDTATTPNEQLVLLSHIGLFFKPDKTSILKVDAKSFTWDIDTEKIEEDTMYIFPDPSRYGNIGNNKDANYPFIMQFKMDYDIRNLSSGNASNDPLLLVGSQGWHSYYSKQDDIFKTHQNANFEYAFTSLANRGIVSDYQTDVYGNEFGLFKGYEEVWGLDEEGHPKLEAIKVVGKFDASVPSYEAQEEEKSHPLIFNGGYFEDPAHPSVRDASGNIVIQGKPFDFNKQLTIDEFYHWSGVKLNQKHLVLPEMVYPFVNFGHFGDAQGIDYVDHYRYFKNTIREVEDNTNVITQLLSQFFTTQVDTTNIIREEKSFEEIAAMGGQLYLRNGSSGKNKPTEFFEVFHWVPESIKEQEVIRFAVKNNVVLLETADKFAIIPYTFNGSEFTKRADYYDFVTVAKKAANDYLYVESERAFYIVTAEVMVDGRSSSQSETDVRLVPSFYKFSCDTCEMKEVLSLYDVVLYDASHRKNTEKTLNKTHTWDEYMSARGGLIAASLTSFKQAAFDRKEAPTDDFIIQYNENQRFDGFHLSYNNSLKTFILAYITYDAVESPLVYQHQFKLDDLSIFTGTLVTNVYTISNEKQTLCYQNTLYQPNKVISPNKDEIYGFLPLSHLI